MPGKQVKVVGFGKKNPNQLFAVGHKEGEFYFISPPIDGISKIYFQQLYAQVLSGNKPTVFITAEDRKGTLIPYSVLEDKIQQEDASSQTPSGYQSEVDLYSIIHPLKEQHFKDYGRVLDYRYEEKMQALKEGRPQIRLNEDPLARAVVRAILSINNWRPIEGKDAKMSTHGATTFPQVSNDEIINTLYALMNEDGLLDVRFGGCGSSGLWVFESEIIYFQQQIYFPSKSMDKFAKFERNPILRDAISTIISPYEDNSPLYKFENF